MQFIDLAAQQSGIRHKLEQRIKAVLDHGNYIMGPEVGELEEKLAAFSGARHCIFGNFAFRLQDGYKVLESGRSRRFRRGR